MGSYGAIRAIHYHWSVSKPCWNTHFTFNKFVDASVSPSWVILGNKHQSWSQNSHENGEFGVHSLSEVWGDMETGESSTASEVLQNLALVFMFEARSFWMHLIVKNEFHWGHICQGNTTNILELGGTLSLANGMIWYKENHPLPLKYFNALFQFLYQNHTVYEGIYLPLMCHIVPLPSVFIAKTHWNA